MKIIGMIPTRYGSSRLPGKPLIHIQGKPMIAHVIEQAKRIQGLDALAVATDHADIAACAEALGVQAIMTDPDCPSGTDRIAQALTKMTTTDRHDQDWVINIQGDQPVLVPAMIEALIRDLKQPSYDFNMASLRIAITDEADKANPNIVKVVTDQKGKALYFSRSTIPYDRDDQNTMPVYKHIGTYAYKVGFLNTIAHLPPSPLEQCEQLEQLRVLEAGYAIHMTTSQWDVLDVNIEADVQVANKALQKSAAMGV